MNKKTITVAALLISLFVLSVLMLFVSMSLSLAFAIGIIIAATVFFKPFYGLVIYIILIYVMPQVFIQPLQRLRIMLTMAALIMLIYFIHKIVRREKISFIPTRQSLLILLLLMIVPISNIVNFQLNSAWDGFNEFLTVFILFFLITNLITNSSEFRKVCWTLVACTTLLALNGLLMQFRGYDIVGNVPLQGRIRWMSHFGDPNDFALAITSILPFTLVHLFSGHANKAVKALLIVITIVFTAAIVFTESRGGYIAFILILGTFSIKKWGWIKGGMVGIIFLAIALVIAPSRMNDLDPYGQSAGTRVQMWIGGLMLLRSHPILGIGYGMFTNTLGRASHSAFIECMAEMGVIGYFLWMSLLYSSIVDIRVIQKSDFSTYNEYSPILQLSLIGFLGGAVFLSQAYSPMLYIILGLISASIRNTELSAQSPKMLAPKEILKITIIIGLSIAGYKLLAMVY